MAVEDFGKRLGPMEVSVGAASGDASGAREEARASLLGVREVREDFGRRLENFRRDALSSVHSGDVTATDEATTAASLAAAAERFAREAKISSDRAESQAQQAFKELHHEHRAWRLEADEHARLLGAVERSRREAALGSD